MDSKEELESLLDRAKKIHGYTKSGNVNEAANAAAKLTEFLLKYNLDISQVEDHSTIKEESMGRDDREFYGSVINWQVDLANVISKANLCKTVLSQRSGNKIVWLGKPSNIQVAQYIFDTAVFDIKDMATSMWNIVLQARKMPEMYDKLGEELRTIHGKEWKNTFYMGAVKGIQDRLKAEVEELRQNENMNALVIYNDRALKEYTRTVFPKLSKHTTNFKQNSGYGAGQKFGSEYQFKTGVGTSGSPLRLNSGNK